MATVAKVAVGEEADEEAGMLTGGLPGVQNIQWRLETRDL